MAFFDDGIVGKRPDLLLATELGKYVAPCAGRACARCEAVCAGPVPELPWSDGRTAVQGGHGQVLYAGSLAGCEFAIWCAGERWGVLRGLPPYFKRRVG